MKGSTGIRGISGPQGQTGSSGDDGRDGATVSLLLPAFWNLKKLLEIADKI